MNDLDIKAILLEALSEMQEENPLLKIESISERAFCFRLGLKIANNFEGYILDSEYNLDLRGNLSKSVPNVGRLLEIASLLKKSIKPHKLLVPDFIVHKRTETFAENLLAVEIKWHTANPLEIEFAEEKLKALKVKFEYKFCVLLVLPREWFDFPNRCSLKFI